MGAHLYSDKIGMSTWMYVCQDLLIRNRYHKMSQTLGRAECNRNFGKGTGSGREIVKEWLEDLGET